MGNKFKGNNHRNSGSGHHRNLSEPDPSHGVVQHQDEKILEIHISTHRAECSEGIPADDGPTLGKDSKSMVGISDRWSFAEGAKNNRMEDHSSDFGNSDIMRSEPCGEPFEEEDAGDQANSHMCQEQQAHHQASVGVLAHGGVQPSLSNHQVGDWNSQVLLNPNVRERPINGDAEADGMELERGGEISTSC